MLGKNNFLRACNLTGVVNIILLMQFQVSDGSIRFICYSSVLYDQEQPHSSGNISKLLLTDNAGDIIQIQMYALAVLLHTRYVIQKNLSMNLILWQHELAK